MRDAVLGLIGLAIVLAVIILLLIVFHPGLVR